MRKKSLKIGIAGLGTVGVGVLKILDRKSARIEKRARRKIEILAVSAKNKSKDRGVPLDDIRWEDDPIALAKDNEIDVVIELIGGAEGIAYELAKKSLENKKSFITANKALIATHGVELAKLAEKNGVSLLFEASVAGGIPIIDALKKGLSANNISRVTGILNGTCNYILTAMQNDKRDFEDVLAEAQKLGYAEADPTFDIDGVDTAHKLSILTCLAFGCPVNCDDMHVEGIRNISLSDIEYANHLGYKIKLLGVAQRSEGGIEQRVHPCLVSVRSPMAQVDGVLNAISVECDSLGPLFFEGAGAGEQPTASAVVSDIIEIASGVKTLPFGISVEDLQQVKFIPMDAHEGEYYIRLTVKDEAGVLAAITSALSEQGVGVEQVLQPHTRDDKTADIVITTHKTSDKSIENVMVAISKMGDIIEPPHVIRIEN